MKELSHLNKYLFKYKHYLVLGTIFIIIANLFKVIPAVVVRHSFDVIESSISIYKGFSGFELQDNTHELFLASILLFVVVSHPNLGPG